MQERRSNPERTAATRQALLEAARKLFSENGYQATSTPDIVALAGVTRGALYHHFADKLDLFQAVLEEEGEAIGREIEDGAKQANTSLEALRIGAQAYFKAMRDAARVRLLLVEGPAALGAQEMRRIDLETGGRELRVGLAEAMPRDMPEAEIDALADMISAMFDRAVLAHANGSSTATYERALNAVLTAIVSAPTSITNAD